LGFFVLVVLVVEAILGAVAGISTGSDRTFAILGILLIICGLVSVVAFLAYSRPEALRGVRAGADEEGNDAANMVRRGARAIIDSSSLAMYLTDENLVVLHCNNNLTALLDSQPSAIVGKHLIELVKRFGSRVPTEKRQAFMERQQALVDKVAADFAPHSEELEIIDNRDLVGSQYCGAYRVWIHADKISVDAELCCIFVVYHVERISDELVMSAIQGSQK
jgi:PAS domain-containing protein